MLFTVGGGEVKEIKKAWLEEHGNSEHPHAAVIAEFEGEGLATLDDVCSYGGLRATGGSLEIAREMQKAIGK